MSRMSAPQTLSGEECFMLFSEISKSGPTPLTHRRSIRNRLMVLLMLDAGLRVGEMVQLKIPDLWFQDQPVHSLTVRRSISKTKQERTIPLSERIIIDIQQMQTAYWYVAEPFENKFAFSYGLLNQHVSCRHVERILAKASLKGIGRKVHPHMLRHTFATRIMKHSNTRVVQELLGHKCLSSTQIYTHVTEQDKSDAIKQLLLPVSDVGHCG